MKRTKLFAIILIAVVLLLVLSIKAYAASASLSVSDSEIKPGDSVTVTVTGDSMAAWSINVSASGPASGDGINEADATADAKNTSKTFSTTYTATEAGTITISLSGDVTGEDGETTDLDSSRTITVTALEPDPIPSSNSEPSTTQEPITDTEPTTAPEPTKSSNANLGNLGITPNDFTGFRYSVTSYDVSVPYDVDEIEIYANKLEDSQTITGTGSKSLSEGSNVFDVTVTAEDGTEKTYTLTIVRLAKEKTNEPNINNNNETKIEIALASLQIAGVTLNESFKPNVYEYTAVADKDTKMVVVNGSANVQDAIIDIDAPDELKDGENIIKITVKEKNGDGKKIYTIKVMKNVEESKESKNNTIVPAAAGTTGSNKSGGSGISKQAIIYCIGVAVVTALGILFAVIRYRKDRAYEYEDEDEFDFVGDISAKEAVIDAAVATSKLAGVNNETVEEGATETRRRGKHF